MAADEIAVGLDDDTWQTFAARLQARLTDVHEDSLDARDIHRRISDLEKRRAARREDQHSGAAASE